MLANFGFEKPTNWRMPGTGGAGCNGCQPYTTPLAIIVPAPGGKTRQGQTAIWKTL